MKGRRLSLEEVLRLDDGTKVWVEELDDRYKGDSDLYKKIKEKLYILNTDMYYDLKCDFITPIEFYEWIEDELAIPDQIEEPYYSQSVVESMANEIARHRYPNKYEYDDKMIEMIIKEFS